MNKEFNKIRKLLGNEYHLYESISINGIKWVLYKKYEDSKVYFSKDNEPIMSSDTHTLEQLKEFVKKHKRINYELVESIVFVIISIINLIIIFMNSIFIKNEFLRGITSGISYSVIVSCLIHIIILSKNNKVDELEHKELIRRELKRFER